MLDEHSTSIGTRFSYVIVFLIYMIFFKTISYKERGYPCEYFQYIYVQIIFCSSSEDFILSFAKRSQEGYTGGRMNVDE